MPPAQRTAAASNPTSSPTESAHPSWLRQPRRGRSWDRQLDAGVDWQGRRCAGTFAEAPSNPVWLTDRRGPKAYPRARP
jgi:hypothetical protein